MITDIIDSMNDYKGAYLDKVKAFMQDARNFLTGGLPGFEDDVPENPIMRYDFDSYCLKKRIEGTVSGITEARKRLSDILSSSQLDALFAYANSMLIKGGYNHEVDKFNMVALSSAIWILDELLLSGNIEKIYQYLPACDEDEYNETLYLPVKHPVYEDDLIFSLVYLIRHRNTSKNSGECNLGSLVWEQTKADSDEKSLEYRSSFDSIIALINPEAIKEAVHHFEEKVWEFYRISFSIMAAVEKKGQALIDERDNLQNQMAGNTRNVLLMPTAQDDSFDDEIEILDDQIDRLEHVTFTDLSSPNDREKLVKSLKGLVSTKITEKLVTFHVDDPFETAFAMLYLMDTNSIIPWYYFGSISVGYTMCDQLPYDTRSELPEKPIKLSGWNSALYQHRYKGYRFEDMTDSDGEPVKRSYAKNLSQVVFSNTLSLIPRVVPEQADLTEYFNDLGELSEHEKEAYSLLSFILVAGRLRTGSIFKYQALQEVKQLIEDYQEEEADLQVDDKQLETENARLRAKNRELIEKISDMLASQKSDSKLVQLLQHQIELQAKELTDLREAVYLLKNDTISEAPADETIRYPYETSGKIISFGGHDKWLKEMRKKLPNVMFISPDSLPNIDLIRHADTVWLQTDCLSHSDFYRIINIVHQNGIPLRYFSFAGSEKCAEQLVKSEIKSADQT